MYVYDPNDQRETPQCVNKCCYGKGYRFANHGSHCQADIMGAECGDPLCESCGETLCVDCEKRLCNSCNRRTSNEDEGPGCEDLCTACLAKRPQLNRNCAAVGCDEQILIRADRAHALHFCATCQQANVTENINRGLDHELR